MFSRLAVIYECSAIDGFGFHCTVVVVEVVSHVERVRCVLSRQDDRSVRTTWSGQSEASTGTALEPQSGPSNSTAKRYPYSHIDHQRKQPRD